jgi:hypothetical protein
VAGKFLGLVSKFWTFEHKTSPKPETRHLNLTTSPLSATVNQHPPWCIHLCFSDASHIKPKIILRFELKDPNLVFPWDICKYLEIFKMVFEILPWFQCGCRFTPRHLFVVVPFNQREPWQGRGAWFSNVNCVVIHVILCSTRGVLHYSGGINWCLASI